MTSITLEFPEEAFGALRRSPEAFAAEMRLAAAIHWYQQSMISQGRAAMLAGMPRMEFLDELARRGIDVVRVDVDELRREVESAS
jgi:predicted HTH domain antitoxin